MDQTIYVTHHPSPLGELTLASHDGGLCGIYFPEHRNVPEMKLWTNDDGMRFDRVRVWLDQYFEGNFKQPAPMVSWISGTPFQTKVWTQLTAIPVNQCETYGKLAEDLGVPKAARAVGSAVGRNPISILVPCHRVVGSNGNLSGYAGGQERKAWLLQHEAQYFGNLENDKVGN